MEKYDAILMVTANNIPLLKISSEYICNNLGADKVYFIGNKTIEEDFNKFFGKFEKILFIDEDSVIDDLSLKSVRNILLSICNDDHRAGWYFQQFLKMAYSHICQNDFYLVFDADTVPLNPISYFSEDGKPRLVAKYEYYDFYFKTINTLFNGKVKRVEEEVSYIAENMLISKRIMLEIIDCIMKNDSLTGNSFYERILYAIDRSYVKDTGFSEFETYGNYVMTYYPDLYEKYRLRTQRLGSFLFGTHPTPEQLKWASEDYDIISFESHGRKWLSKKTNSKRTLEKYSARELFEKYIRISNLCDRLMGRPIPRIDK